MESSGENYTATFGEKYPAIDIIYRRPGSHAKITVIAIDHLSYLGEIALAGELPVSVYKGMEFVPKLRLRSLLCPGTIMASPRPGWGHPAGCPRLRDQDQW